MRVVTATTVPSTTMVAERPRPRPVQRMNARNGTSNTSARNTARNTMISVLLDGDHRRRGHRDDRRRR